MTALQVRCSYCQTARWAALERATIQVAEEGRSGLVERLADPSLLHDIDLVLARFDSGADPLPDDETWVSTMLSARAMLAATAPCPDPLSARLADLDRAWAERAPVAWVLGDQAWAACFSDLPSPTPDTWWGARGCARAPSEGALLSALEELRASVPAR